jgi:hypothetical protein
MKQQNPQTKEIRPKPELRITAAAPSPQPSSTENRNTIEPMKTKND